MLFAFGTTSAKANSDTPVLLAETSELADTSNDSQTDKSTEKITKKKKSKKTKVIKKSTKVKVNQNVSLKKLTKLSNKKVKKYSFRSKNKKVAKVSKTGTVTGVKKGSTTIVVTSKSDKSVYAKIKVTVDNNYSATDLRYMAAIIYSEARGECYAGQKAVGIVVMNRVKSELYSDTVKEVIYERGQFTPTVNGSLNHSLALYDSGKLSKSCIKAAKAVLNGDTKVNYRNKTYDLKGYLFFSRYVYGCKLQIQNHQFK